MELELKREIVMLNPKIKKTKRVKQILRLPSPSCSAFYISEKHN